ncbi:MAG: putative ATPase central domain protein [Gemmatimonadetes bacterium]|nr:putative ATPase central domain protein [Gemmatimonadota bacterium]
MIARAHPAGPPAQDPLPGAAGAEDRRAGGLARSLKAARRVSVPLVAVTTPDPAATIETIGRELAAEVPQVEWDGARGMRGRNDAGHMVRQAVLGTAYDPTVANPLELFTQAQRLPEETVLWVHMANRWIASPPVIQALWNLRDEFKQDRRTVVLLAPAIDLPPELAGDVLVLDDPLPGPAALEVIVREVYAAAELAPREEDVGAAVEAVQGLPAFQAEQVAAMSLTPDGLDVDAVWEHKRRQIELTPGLKVQRGGSRFADVGGVETVKGFLGRVLAGNSPPGAVVFLDEIEKFLAGASGDGADSSGVSQDQLGTILSYMQDEGAMGALFVGPPGSAKSMVAKACGNEAGIPTIQLDLGGVKGSLVGESERQLRAALKVVTSVSNGRSLWLATSNSITSLPPELRRRFGLGTYFFDIPTEGERERIWEIWLRKYGLDPDGALPRDHGWTGAEIRQCCDIAWRLRCPLAEAADFVVPVSLSSAEQLDQLRRAADGRFLSASAPGVYRHLATRPAPAPRSRRVTHDPNRN